jgi:hypothetical protein
VIVSGIVTAALMKYRTKTATSWTEAIRRHGDRRRRTSWARRIPDRAEDRRGCCCPVRARPVLPLRALSARLGLSGASDRGQPFRSMAIGEEAEVTNAMEAVGQGVEQEAPDELVGLQTHGLYGAVVAIVLPGEGDIFVVATLDAAVGDGDAMGVAAR